MYNFFPLEVTNPIYNESLGVVIKCFLTGIVKITTPSIIDWETDKDKQNIMRAGLYERLMLPTLPIEIAALLCIRNVERRDDPMLFHIESAKRGDIMDRRR